MTTEKDYQNRRTENVVMETLLSDSQFREQLLNGTDDKNPNQLCTPHHQYQTGILQLNRIFEVLQNELKESQDGLSISSERVEMEIAKCISQCLQDVPLQKRNISYVQALLRLYKVVVPLQNGNHSVSLHKVHMILQDNYADSCLCGLMNIFLAGFLKSETKVISF